MRRDASRLRLALLIGILTLGALGWGAAFRMREATVARAEETYARLEVQGPRIVPTGAPVSLLVRTTTVSGKPRSLRIVATLEDSAGTCFSRVTTRTDAEGDASLRLGTEEVGPSRDLRARVRALDDEEVVAHASLIVRVRPGLQARISTDRPLYRPGDTVHIRLVVLEQYRHRVCRECVVFPVALRDSRGVRLAEAMLVLDGGVASGTVEIPAEAPGGEYVLRLRPGDVPVASTDCPIRVRRFRLPRAILTLDLARDSYGPGDSGQARLRASRADGSASRGARVDATLIAGEHRTRLARALLPASGELTLSFTVPEDARPETVRLVATVIDGGDVATVSRPVPITSGGLTAEIFPEGGEAVAGLPGRAYFRVRDPAGRPSDLAVRLVDGTGREVAATRPGTLGIGILEWTPAAGEVYRLVPAAGIPVTLDAPDLLAVPEGVTLRALDPIARPDAPIRVEIASTTAGRHAVVLHGRGALLAQASVRLRSGVARRVELPRPPEFGGVLRITVHGPDGTPRAERLLWAESVRRLEVEVRPESPAVAPRSWMRVHVRTRDESGAPRPATLGISVVDRALLGLARDDLPASLPAHFLLGVEVERLEDVPTLSPGVDASIDLLLATQGWRRFRTLARGASTDRAERQRPSARAWSFAEPQRVDDDARAAAAVAEDLGPWADLTRKLLGASMALLGFSLAVAAALAGHTRLHAAGLVAACSVVVAGLAVGVGWPGEDSPVRRPPVPVRFLPRPLPPLPEYPPIEFGFDEDDGEPYDLGPLVLGIGGGRVVLPRWLDLDDGPILDECCEAIAFSEDPIDPRQRAAPDPIVARLRVDRDPTIAWIPRRRTNAKGHTDFDLRTSDALTTYEIAVEAFDSRGVLAVGHATLGNRLPMSIKMKAPLVVTAGDVLRVPFVVGNDTTEPLDVTVRAGVGDGSTSTVRVEPGRRVRTTRTVVAAGTEIALDGEARTEEYADRIRRRVEVRPRGFPVEQGWSGILVKTHAIVVDLPADLDPAALEGGLEIYPSAVAQLLAGLDAMVREPHGCFEQVTSANYPNVLVLRCLHRLGRSDHPAALRASRHLTTAHAKIAGYECAGGGFSLYGREPASLWLTALGLAQLTDMSEVHPVDPALLARTRAWLRAHRAGGGEAGAPKRSHASTKVRDAYVLLALAESRPGEDLAGELDALRDRAGESRDGYLVALAANALAARGHPGVRVLTDRLREVQREDGRVAAGTTSVTGSLGTNLDVETTALAARAFLRGPDHVEEARRAFRFLIRQLRHGRFGATQATILALKAFEARARLWGEGAASGTIRIIVNDATVARGVTQRAGARPLRFGAALREALRPGRNRVELCSDRPLAVPFSLTLSYRTDRPVPDARCALTVATRLDRGEILEGEAVGIEVTVTNRTDDTLPSTLIRLGIPGGLEPDADRLRTLEDLGAADRVETRPGEVVLYLAGLGPGEVKRIRLGTIAAVPGTYAGVATCAYLYYTDDRKAWADPLRVTIAPRAR